MSRRNFAGPAALSAADAAEAIRERRLTSEALVRACLDRIAEREPDVQAWAHLDPDYALAQARARDGALKLGRGAGPLHGVPIGIKDIFDTADFPTENGSPIFAGRRPEKDAACVARLCGAGAVILGKTVTRELALLNPARTRNRRQPLPPAWCPPLSAVRRRAPSSGRRRSAASTASSPRSGSSRAQAC